MRGFVEVIYSCKRGNARCNHKNRQGLPQYLRKSLSNYNPIINN